MEKEKNKKIKWNMKERFNLFTGVFLIASGMILSGPSITGFSVFSGNTPLPNILSIALIFIGIFELFVFFREIESK
ncbi:MAG: hypothetical protein AABY32_06355 [Nanoarchaeota archaeon]